MATKYVDNRLTTGANDGSSPGNAFHSLFDAEVGTIAAGDTVEVVAGSGPYYEATSVNSALRVYATDISFNAAARTITTAGAVSFLAYNTPGNIRIQGSRFNDGQYTVASATANVITLSATNKLVDESALNRIRVIDITNTETSGNRCFAWDPGRNGTAGAAGHINWNFNDCEVSAGLDLMNSKYTWVKSASGTNEYYVKLLNDSNPSLNKPESAVVNGNFMCASAGDATHNRGAVGSLSFNGQYGYGNNDSLGYNTVYVRWDAGNPQTLGVSVRVGQLFTCYYQVWNYQTINKCRFSFGNGGATGVASGCCVQARGIELWFRRCVFMYADGCGFESSANGPFVIEQCVGYWTGHRFWTQGNTATIVTSIFGCLDRGSHLFALIGASVGAGCTVNIYGCVSSNNEAGAIDKKASAATLNADYNCWFPRMTAAGGALGYVSPTNWPNTNFHDVPALIPTVENNQANLYDPRFTAVDDFNYNNCNWTPKPGSPLIGSGPFVDANRLDTIDLYGQRFNRINNIGPVQNGYSRIGTLSRLSQAA
jgi:hypothetical protein